MKLPWEKDRERSQFYNHMGTPTMKQKITYQIKSYPDKTKYVELSPGGNSLTYKINSYEDLWVLNQINDVLVYQKRTCKLLIPCLLDAQADRRFEDNQPHSLRLVCNFLNQMTAFQEIRIFHPHNAEVVEALIPRATIEDNQEFIEEVLSELVENYDFNTHDMWSKMILFATDSGGFKPMMKLADKLDWEGETFSASKSRKYENGHSKLVQLIDRQDFKGKDILIIDDLMVGGKTFVGLAELLKERNCGKLYLAVSHITIENPNPNIWNVFDRVFTTNSKFDRYLKPLKFRGDSYEPKNLKVLTLF